MAENGISYGTKDEFEFRFQIYHKSDLEINEINNDPNLTFTAKHNQFSTLTADEAKKWMGRLPNENSKANPTYLPIDNTYEEVDWRKVGAVNPVQNQGQCGSCWAFSSAAAMESEHYINSGELLKLSEQQFNDCAWAEGNHGC